MPVKSFTPTFLPNSSFFFGKIITFQLSTTPPTTPCDPPDTREKIYGSRSPTPPYTPLRPPRHPRKNRGVAIPNPPGVTPLTPRSSNPEPEQIDAADRRL